MEDQDCYGHQRGWKVLCHVATVQLQHIPVGACRSLSPTKKTNARFRNIAYPMAELPKPPLPCRSLLTHPKPHRREPKPYISSLQRKVLKKCSLQSHGVATAASFRIIVQALLLWDTGVRSLVSLSPPCLTP